MGIDAYVTDSRLVVIEGHDAAALAVVQRWSREAVDEGATKLKIARAKTPAQAFAALGFDVELDAEGRLERVFYEGRIPDWWLELEPLCRKLAPHVEPGSFVTYRMDGEDEEETIELHAAEDE